MEKAWISWRIAAIIGAADLFYGHGKAASVGKFLEIRHGYSTAF